MQDIHSIGGGGGRLFGGGGERRLRPQHNQILKCPRCDSLNTKFCYYNNYNLSQPRHFCKSCRRYWTKGGVLRNVPVGGGCRKTKRSKQKASADAPRDRKSSSHSSSESSSLTASTTAATAASTAAAATPEIASVSSSTSASTLLNFPDSMFFTIPQTPNPSFDPPLVDHSLDCGILPEIGSFTNLVMPPNDPSLLGFNVPDISASAYRLQQQNQNTNQQWQQQQKVTSTMPDDLKMQDITTGFLDQTAQVDWQAGGGDQVLFDLTGTVDQAYWSQTQWTDNDQPLYLP